MSLETSTDSLVVSLGLDVTLPLLISCYRASPDTTSFDISTENFQISDGSYSPLSPPSNSEFLTTLIAWSTNQHLHGLSEKPYMERSVGDEEREARGDRRNYEAQLSLLMAKVDAIGPALAAESKLLQQQIGFTDRNAAQLVRLVEEKLSAVNEKVAAVAAQQNEDRKDFLLGIETVQKRVMHLENFKTKLVGIALGISLASGGIAGAIVRFIE